MGLVDLLDMLKKLAKGFGVGLATVFVEDGQDVARLKDTAGFAKFGAGEALRVRLGPGWNIGREACFM